MGQGGPGDGTGGWEIGQADDPGMGLGGEMGQGDDPGMGQGAGR